MTDIVKLRSVYSDFLKEFEYGEGAISVILKNYDDLKYLQAYEYLGERLGTPLVFSCCSWMTRGENQRLLPETSGIRAFASDHDLTPDYDGSGHLWSIFGRTDCCDVSSCPRVPLLSAYKSNICLRAAISAYPKDFSAMSRDLVRQITNKNV